MEKLPTIRRMNANRGAVLLLALVFMLMLAMIATTVMQTAVLQLHMAGNDQFLEEAWHKAQAIATELSLNQDNFSLAGGVGYSNCPPGAQSLNCDRSQLPVPASAVQQAGVELDYRVTRQEPLLWRGFPIRESQDTVSSSNSFDAATFEIDVRINGGEKQFGSAHIAQGIAVRVAAFR
jgi:Tfp pilus assembly protein PilX